MNRLNIMFYLKYWYFKILPFFFYGCCDQHRKVRKFDGSKSFNDPTFDDIVNYYEELNSQVQYQLSLKNLANLGIDPHKVGMHGSLHQHSANRRKESEPVSPAFIPDSPEESSEDLEIFDEESEP